MLWSEASELLMSWGYWGIVAGLVALVAIFFVSMELLYSNVKGSLRAPGDRTDEPVESAGEAPPSGRYAA